MNITNISKRELKAAVKEALWEVLEARMVSFRPVDMPYVSKREQKEIEKKFEKPSHDIAKTIRVRI